MRKTTFLAAALLASAAPAFVPPSNTRTYTEGGVTYAQKGGIANSNYVVTAISPGALGAVKSVNSKTGTVVLAASDVGAISATNSTMTAAGVVTDYLGQQVGGSVFGGPRIRYSSTSAADMTTYAYAGVAVRRGGVNSDYRFDDSDDGVVRRRDLSSVTPGAYETVSNEARAAYARLRPGALGVPEFSTNFCYEVGTVVSHTGVLYRCVLPYDTVGPFYKWCWEPVDGGLQDVFSGSMRQSYLRLGHDGFSSRRGFKVFVGWTANDEGTWLHGDNDYYEGCVGVYSAAGRGVYLHPDGYIHVMRGGHNYSTYDITSFIDDNKVVPMIQETIQSGAPLAVSPRYVYQYLTNLYFTAQYTDSSFLRKSDAQADYLRKSDAGSAFLSNSVAQAVYARKEYVADQVAQALERVPYVYDYYGGHRLGYDGVVERAQYNTSWNGFVAFTNKSTGLVLYPDPDASSRQTSWVGTHPVFGTIHVTKSNGGYSCTELPGIHATEDYENAVVVEFSGPGMGTFTAFPYTSGASVSWYETYRFARAGDVPGVVSNVVTKAYVEGLGIETDFTTGNPVLVSTASTVTSNTVTKAYVEDLGVSSAPELDDEVRHCTWVQAVTNGVFYWYVKEE